MIDETDARVIVTHPFIKDPARKPQNENIRNQLSKLGNTPFEVVDIVVDMTKNYFIPSSLLNEMRRRAAEKLSAVRRIRYRRRYAKENAYGGGTCYPLQKLDYTANISNQMAEDFYKKYGVAETEPAFETAPRNDVPLMYSKHCIRYSMGWCPVHHKSKSPYQEPFFLRYKSQQLRLDFDCKKCRMLVWNTE
jgi:putative protease